MAARANHAQPRALTKTGLSAPSAPWSSKAARCMCCMWAMRASTGCKARRGSNHRRPPRAPVVGGVVPGRALGTGPHIEIDYRCLEAEAGDLYLLATDGAYTHLDAASVHSAVQQFPDDLDAAAQALVDIAQARGPRTTSRRSCCALTVCRRPSRCWACARNWPCPLSSPSACHLRAFGWCVSCMSATAAMCTWPWTSRPASPWC